MTLVANIAQNLQVAKMKMLGASVVVCFVMSLEAFTTSTSLAGEIGLP
jgi:hypothetical protein